MSEKEWWDTGLGDNVDDAAKRQKALSGPPRFWMPEDTSKEVVFLDQDGFSFWEHSYYANGNFFNYAVCLKENGIEARCPLCESGNKPYYIGMFSIIDCSRWTDKQGREHKDVPKMFPAKMEVLKKVRKRVNRLKDEGKSIAGARYEIGRGGKRDYSTGSDFEFIRHVDLKDEFPEAKPFVYQDYFEPMSIEEMEAVVRGGAGGNRKDDRDDRQEDDAPPPADYGPENDVPF